MAEPVDQQPPAAVDQSQDEDRNRPAPSLLQTMRERGVELIGGFTEAVAHYQQRVKQEKLVAQFIAFHYDNGRVPRHPERSAVGA
jgi:hypothetical protein